VAHTRTASKVPEITAYFWGIKILTTGMGETTSESIHSIHTRRRELFYWAAVLVTFALGTAAGRHDGIQPEPRIPGLGVALRRAVRRAGDRPSIGGLGF
jgi:uncharacterized membrane-anchored protein